MFTDTYRRFVEKQDEEAFGESLYEAEQQHEALEQMLKQMEDQHEQRRSRLKQPKPAWLYACIATLAAFAYLYKYPPYPQYCVLFAELTPWVRFMLTSALQQLSTPIICKALRNA
tara:strand:- start:42 stop:386 length:345 start_codon:yes stop_codon:yes gene_type:complete